MLIVGWIAGVICGFAGGVGWITTCGLSSEIGVCSGPLPIADTGSIVTAGRWTSGPYVQVNISSGGFGAFWPEWAYGIAEGALHFNKKVWVIYNNQPFGSNLLQVLCTNTPI